MISAKGEGNGMIEWVEGKRAPRVGKGACGVECNRSVRWAQPSPMARLDAPFVPFLTGGMGVCLADGAGKENVVFAIQCSTNVFAIQCSTG